jgi:hypothetical protein
MRTLPGGEPVSCRTRTCLDKTESDTPRASRTVAKSAELTAENDLRGSAETAQSVLGRIVRRLGQPAAS